MNLLFRLFRILWSAFHAAPQDILTEDVLTFRVWPNDLDFNAHMNNGRYLTVMDLGRLHLMGRAGLLKAVFKKRWGVVLGGATIRFRRPLKPFQKYRLKTQLVGWDEKWFYLRQTFEAMDGTLMAEAIVRGLFTTQGRSIPSQEALSFIPAWDQRLSPTLPVDTAALQLEPHG